MESKGKRRLTLFAMSGKWCGRED